MYITKEQYQEIYGDRKTDIDLTFTETINGFRHYYLQRENDVLHVNDEGCINILPVGHLNLTNPSLEPCDKEEFEKAILDVIFSMDIYQYVKSN